MTGFTMELADIAVGVECQFTATADLCSEYLTDRSAAFSVKVEPADLVFEKERVARTARLHGQPRRSYPDEYLETLALYRKISERMPFYHTVLFHCSALAADGEGYLFTAKSGTGKSTHARLWREYLGERVVMVNDDKPLVRVTGDGAFVFGTPWRGKHRLGRNMSAPIKAVCLLERGQENAIREISAAEAYPMLLQQTYRPADPEALQSTMSLLDDLAERVRFFRLSCNMDVDAARVAYEGMNHSGESI